MKPLTTGQLHICAMVANGYLNKEIADELGVSLEVAAQRLKRIMRRLNATNRAMVAVWYVRQELAQ
jgi:DNA-binding NarL/FixJ family response regulator